MKSLRSVIKQKIYFYCDGGFSTRKYPISPAYGSFIIKKEDYLEGHSKPITTWSDQKHINHPVEVSTTQAAEVATLIWTLEFIKANVEFNKNEVTIQIIMDSQFTLSAVQDRYKLKAQHLIKMLNYAKEIIKECKCNFKFHWIDGNKMKLILGH